MLLHSLPHLRVLYHVLGSLEASKALKHGIIALFELYQSELYYLVQPYLNHVRAQYTSFFVSNEVVDLI